MSGIPPHIQTLVEAAESSVASLQRSMDQAWLVDEVLPAPSIRAALLRDVITTSTRLTEALRTFDAIANVTVKKAGS